MCAAVRCLSTGQSFSIQRCIAQKDVDTFVHLTGDSNPIHSENTRQLPDQQGANQSDQAVVPGMMMASLFPAIIGSKFPGALYLSQTLKFRQPAVVGTSVLATVTVAKQSGSRVTFDTVCQDSNGRILVDGSALALIKPPAC
jgi:3-hydroxybutyryl-CoA dehydratase